ncbi:uncharacterized protein LOC129568561 [Sitodiplosis mosellana]|uniref:uncharacterized protein LOC129568561 n=1 Tax=Sitodiplosis mosellana TaxID=263140 RepID=UPI002443FABC|nr:uncharacterized protein LOC129568561 [Sitodiplosis mosellana]
MLQCMTVQFQAAAIMSFLDVTASIVFMSLVRFTGKRPIYLVMSLGTFFSSAIIPWGSKHLETTLSLPGAKLFFCVVSGLGFVLMYLILPETENISLEDIERHFSDNSKKITDRKIRKSNEKT